MSSSVNFVNAWSLGTDNISLQLILSRSVSYSNPARLRTYGLSYNVLRIDNGNNN